MIHNGSFSGGTKHGIYRNEQPPPTKQRLDLKGKGAVVANALPMRELANRTLEKLRAMTDEEFAELDVYAADEE